MFMNTHFFQIKRFNYLLIYNIMHNGFVNMYFHANVDMLIK